MMPSEILSQRTMSSFPLSIGTGLALESLFSPTQEVYDPLREAPQKIDLKRYRECWINVATLFRNIHGSIDSLNALMCEPSMFFDVLLQEMEVIDSLFHHEGKDQCKPIYYLCDYRTPYTHQKHNAVKLRQDVTLSQKNYTASYLETCKIFKKSNYVSNVKWLDYVLRPEQMVSALCISHFPIDLLSQSHFRRLDLLESHTGKLKTRSLWYTKYHPVGKEDLSTLPFHDKLLKIFGDKVMFHPMFHKFRMMILEISRKRGWNPLTTEAKVAMDLELDIKEKMVLDVFQAL